MLTVPSSAKEEIEYVADDIEESLPATDEFDDFKRIFSTFAKPQELFGTASKAANDATETTAASAAGASSSSAKVDEGESSEMSKKKKKLETRLSVAQLKHLVKRPDLIEVWDVTAHDPRLLAHLKAYRNTVPVPRHWSQKRKYLQGKRGIEKAPWQLPDFIENTGNTFRKRPLSLTILRHHGRSSGSSLQYHSHSVYMCWTGIAKIREAYVEKEAEKKSKQRQRDKIQGKTNKIDIDYQVLHDAFFRYQTKPSMSRPGELYYEGKEFEVQVREKRPGFLSDSMKVRRINFSRTTRIEAFKCEYSDFHFTLHVLKNQSALGMPEGSPPPWLINMQ
eukprot:SAG31_NODE_10649_length_1114_cov_0.825616_1_plen_334_part_10